MMIDNIIMIRRKRVESMRSKSLFGEQNEQTRIYFHIMQNVIKVIMQIDRLTFSIYECR